MGENDLSIGFHCGRDTQKVELSNKNSLTTWGGFQIFFRNIILGMHSISKTEQLDEGKNTFGRNIWCKWNKSCCGSCFSIVANDISWYVPRYRPNIMQQYLLSEQNLTEAPTEVSYLQKFLFYFKDITSR